MLMKFSLLTVALLSANSVSWARDVGSASDIAAVKNVLSQYLGAMETLDVRGTERLFAADSEIFESGHS
ncbi:hypothetical protein, partial [Pseudomonas aeruginosa]|uniref:hypothetical protein n=1 Tax=Pseudomonas aeruginosa TaxID=287 RepID=UPI002887F52A